MKKFLPLMFLLLAALGAEPARAAFISGHSYTSVADWASANGFRVQLRRGNGILLTNRAQARLGLQKDSRTAQISGVNVALSFPVIADRGEFLVAQLDWAKTVNPLFFPSRFSGRKIFTIVLDPGHGGKDPGNQTGGHNEKTCTLALANELHDQLVHAGFNVLLTRNRDRFVELAARPDLANRQHADLFVSLHFNATETGKAEVSGPETYCITPVGASSSNAQGEGANHGACPANRVEDKSLLLAYQVQKSLVRTLATEDRSVRRARFAVLRDAAMPAILVESGYMTHPAEGRRILDAGYRKMIAAAIVAGILNYQKLNGPKPESFTTRTPKTAPVKFSKQHI